MEKPSLQLGTFAVALRVEERSNLDLDEWIVAHEIRRGGSVGSVIVRCLFLCSWRGSHGPHNGLWGMPRSPPLDHASPQMVVSIERR